MGARFAQNKGSVNRGKKTSGAESAKLAAWYVVFAVIATCANIASQEAALRIYDGDFSLPLALAVGTAVGLVVKYVLDKRYIFRFRSQNAIEDGRTFFLYAATGVATTAIFWGMETGFYLIFQTRELQYAGGIIGLGIGYFAKYRLDKRFVFRGEVL